MIKKDYHSYNYTFLKILFFIKTDYILKIHLNMSYKVKIIINDKYFVEEYKNYNFDNSENQK